MILVLGTARSHRTPKAVGGLSHLGDLLFGQKTLHKDVMHEKAQGHDEAANHQLPIAVVF